MNPLTPVSRARAARNLLFACALCALASLPAAAGPYTVYAWGRNAAGQSRTQPNLHGALDIAGGWDHSIALKANKTVVCWGSNASGQLNIPPGLVNVRAVAAGYGFSAALKEDGTVTAWGVSNEAQTTVPLGLNNVVAIDCGITNTIALKVDGTVVVWGNDFLGAGHKVVPASLQGQAIKVSIGEFHSMAIKNVSGGQVVAWGRNVAGQSTVPPAALSNVTAIAAGGHHSLALKSDGTVIAWGDNAHLQATVPAGLNDVVEISAGYNFSMARRSGGQLVCWGQNTDDQCAVPRGFRAIGRIAGGGQHVVCTADHPIVCWGYSGEQQCEPPVGIFGVKSIHATDDACVTLQEDMTVRAWGDAAISTVINAPSVTGISFATVGAGVRLNGTINEWDGGTPVSFSNVVALEKEDNHFMALTSDGLAVGWGTASDFDVQPISAAKAIAPGREFYAIVKLDGTLEVRPEFQVGPIPAGLAGVIDIAAGTNHIVALKSDGTIAAWGGPFGTPPAGLTNVRTVCAGGNNSAVIRNDGTFVIWGSNGSGQLNIPLGLNKVQALDFGNNFCMAYSNDEDEDGLPDDWEAFCFGSLAQTASGDTDGDGASNLSEYLSGHDPTNRGARFTVTPILNPALGATFNLNQVRPGMRYALERSATMAPNSWITASEAIYPTAGPQSILQPGALIGRGYFRLRISPRP